MKEQDPKAVPVSPPAGRVPVFLWPTPKGRADVLFYVPVQTSTLPKSKSWAYGDPFEDTNKYPNHKLVHVSQTDDKGWAKWYYAASRESQDDYNWSFHGGNELHRLYLVERALYRQKPEGFVGALPGEFLYPPGATADDTFTDYGFMEDELLEAPDELSSLYVLIRRRFILPTETNTDYDETIERNITVTRELIDKATATGSSTPGIKVEREDGGKFHDWRVTSTVVLGVGESYASLQLSSYIVDVPYRFPELLQSARIVAAWAIADSTEAARSYDEAWYIDWRRVYPAPGPYEARVLRFLTNDVDSLRADYPIIKIVTKPETIGICRAWAYASSKGNSTYAEARQIEVPPSIHGEITIENGDTLSVGQSTNTLPASPNFGEVTGQASMFVAYETKQGPCGLKLVEITEINCTGVYNGVVVPFGTQVAPGVDLPDMGATLPPVPDTSVVTPSGTFSADNTTLTGITSPAAGVFVYEGTEIVGRGVSGTNGNYSILIEREYSDAVALTVRAYVNGTPSVATTVTTNDLSPGRPSGTISADGSTVQGVTEAGATVTILRDAVAQVETLTIPTSQTQIERLTVVGSITGSGNAELVITWPGMTGTPKTITVAVLNLDDEATVASKAAAAAMLDGDVSAFLNVTSDGANILAEALAGADNEATANLALDNDTCTGLTAVTTSTTTQTGSSGLITADGTAIVGLTSGIADWSPLSVPFQVLTGDDMTDVATKAAAALALSVADDDYIPGSSTNDITVTARDVAPNDTTLAITLTAGTCEGLPTPGASANTTPGGTAVSVVANSSGDYFYSFGTPLSGGDVIEVTASDAGGESDPLMLEMSATPPTLATAVFADSDTITGTGTPNGATVRAYVAGVDVGDTTISAGAFTLNTDYKLVRGETVEVAVMATGNEDVRSASIFLTASDLNLEVPVPELVTGGYTGSVPTGATEIRVRNIDTLAETTATISTNDTFFFSTSGEPAGQGFDMYARYATGDSDSIRIFVPTIPKATPFFTPILAPIRNTWTPGSDLDTILGYDVVLPWAYKLRATFQTWVDGMDVTISFPGSDVADIVITNIPSGVDVYDYGPLAYNNITFPFGTPDGAQGGSLKIPLDLSGLVPIPYPVVKVTLDYPDGDSVSATFDRDSFNGGFHHFVNGEWNYDWFSSDYQENFWENYYASSYP